MATITTINSGDLISGSRTDINTNFSNLNTDKIETSTLDTDTALAANSDSKIATQKAVKAYVDAGGNVNASETARGIVEEATDAEVTAGTATGSTGAKLFITPAKLATRIATLFTSVSALIPLPAFPAFAISSKQMNVNTTGWCGKISITSGITTQKISIEIASHAVNGTLKIALFSEDGQTQIFSVTTATITTTGIVSTAISSTTINAGHYYIVVIPVSTTDTSPRTYSFSANVATLNDPASEPVLSGTITVTAGTMPSTITPTSITADATSCLTFRLDN